MRHIVFNFITLSFLIGCSQGEKSVLDEDSDGKQIKTEIDSLTEYDSTIWEIIPYYESEEHKYKIKSPKEESLNIEEGYEEQVSLIELNGDAMSDLIIDLGWIGTGGSSYAIFINQGENEYKKVLEEYLNDMEFIQEKNGWFSIVSYEEIEILNPSKIQKTIFKFNEEKYQYELDTTYIINSDTVN